MTRAAPLVAALALLAACGPVPGGRLSGAPSAVPGDWSGALPDGRAFCEVESRPADPHSIQLECFLFEGALHVQSHRFAFSRWWPAESWAEIWLLHPQVRVRIDGDLYDLTAVHVTDPDARARVLRFRGYDPVPDGIAVFRFEPLGPGAGRPTPPTSARLRLAARRAPREFRWVGPFPTHSARLRLAARRAPRDLPRRG